MYRQLLLATAVFIGIAETTSAGHPPYFSTYGVPGVTVAHYRARYVASGYVHPAGVAYGVPMVYAAPIRPAYPVAVYQPAYIVPPAPIGVATYPGGAVAWGSPGFAPMVPMTDRYGRPRDVDVKLRFRRDGGYRYRVDFD